MNKIEFRPAESLRPGAAFCAPLAIFKVFKSDGKDGSPTTVSLYNCAAERFLQMTDKEVEGSIINRGQSIAKESIQWVPNKITDKLISLNLFDTLSKLS